MEDNVIPFSNGSEYMIWHGKNCEDCTLYENESTSPEDAGCIHAYWIDMADRVSEKTVIAVGGKVNGKFGIMPKHCKLKQ